MRVSGPLQLHLAQVGYPGRAEASSVVQLETCVGSHRDLGACTRACEGCERFKQCTPSFVARVAWISEHDLPLDCLCHHVRRVGAVGPQGCEISREDVTTNRG